jgi:hypothetical protein
MALGFMLAIMLIITLAILFNQRAYCDFDNFVSVTAGIAKVAERAR